MTRKAMLAAADGVYTYGELLVCPFTTPGPWVELDGILIRRYQQSSQQTLREREELGAIAKFICVGRGRMSRVWLFMRRCNFYWSRRLCQFGDNSRHFPQAIGHLISPTLRRWNAANWLDGLRLTYYWGQERAKMTHGWGVIISANRFTGWWFIAIPSQ
jgi:hypothetical protein